GPAAAGRLKRLKGSERAPGQLAIAATAAIGRRRRTSSLRLGVSAIAATSPATSETQAPRLFERYNATANRAVAAPAAARSVALSASQTNASASRIPSAAARPSAFGYWNAPASRNPSEEFEATTWSGASRVARA